MRYIPIGSPLETEDFWIHYNDRDDIELLRISTYREQSDEAVIELFRRDATWLLERLNVFFMTMGDFQQASTLGEAVTEFGKVFNKMDRTKLGDHQQYSPLFGRAYSECFSANCTEVVRILEELESLDETLRSGLPVDSNWKATLMRAVRERSELTPYRLSEKDDAVSYNDMYEKLAPQAILAEPRRSILNGQQCPDQRYMTVGMLRRIAYTYAKLAGRGWT